MQVGRRELFGTDGIRGVAGEYPLDRNTVYAIGRALGSRLHKHHHASSQAGVHVVIGQDTRESSAWIADVLASGLRDSRAYVTSAGVLTTPGVAYITRSHKFAAGIVISASHNPWRDNGIKVFGADGYKLSDQIEHEIEQEIFSHIEELKKSAETALRGEHPELKEDPRLRKDYIQWLLTNVDSSGFSKFRLLVDCANGAASAIAPALFQACGVNAEFMNTSPDGRNINAMCGALHPECVADAVAKSKGAYDLGISFDGDADRALFCDAQGNVVNGDAVLLLAAREMKKRGTLKGNTVVATTMSNMGLEKALREAGVQMLRAPVGDKYVLEQMQKTGATLGGEQSGHILFLDGEATTGDGLLTALRVLEVMAHSGKSLAALVTDMKVFPQSIKNVRVREKKPMEQISEVQQVIKAAEADLDGNGRVVVRYSGTEKLARVMVEAENEGLVKKHVEAISGALQQAIGE